MSELNLEIRFRGETHLPSSSEHLVQGYDETGDAVPGEGGRLPLLNDKVPLIDHEPDQVRGDVRPHVPPLSGVLLCSPRAPSVLETLPGQ